MIRIPRETRRWRNLDSRLRRAGLADREDPDSPGPLAHPHPQPAGRGTLPNSLQRVALPPNQLTMAPARSAGQGSAPMGSASPGAGPARHPFPLTAASGAPDTPSRPGGAAAKRWEGWAGAVGPGPPGLPRERRSDSRVPPKKQMPIGSLPSLTWCGIAARLHAQDAARIAWRPSDGCAAAMPARTCGPDSTPCRRI